MEGSAKHEARIAASGAALIGILLIAALLLAGCGGDDGGTTTAASTGSTSAATTSSTSAGGQTEDTALPPIENSAGPAGYRRLVDGTFQLLDAYWAKQVPHFGDRYTPPSKLLAYQGNRGDPDCGGEPLGAKNAEYCDPTNSIAWDERWLVDDFYDRVGDPAVSFVLAHEYGHLVQARLGLFDKFRYDIEQELNADCLAGVWFGAVNRSVAKMSRADYRSLYAGVFDVSDPRGLPWQNPQAHGNPKERSTALDIGASGGAKDCLRKLGPGFSR